MSSGPSTRSRKARANVWRYDVPGAPGCRNGRDPQTFHSPDAIAATHRTEAFLIARFGSLTLGEVVRTLRASINAGILLEEEGRVLILGAIQRHADKYAGASTECAKADRSGDELAEAVGLPNAEALAAIDGATADVGMRTAIDYHAERRREGKRHYLRRLLSECGEQIDRYEPFL